MISSDEIFHQKLKVGGVTLVVRKERKGTEEWYRPVVVSQSGLETPHEKSYKNPAKAIQEAKALLIELIRQVSQAKSEEAA